MTVAFCFRNSTIVSTALCNQLLNAKGLTPDWINLSPSFAIAYVSTVVVVVPSHANLFVFSAASLTRDAPTL